ncbi:MAG: tetratricopeptide repeat protein [Candidatus Eremiobacteraeota bacterium]|nr:tetratricopeptide repeat protein [Candidatus Eremiobacteraeota bacterium]
MWFTSKLLAVALAALPLTGCAGGVEHWIVNTRVHQGDVAMDRGNVRDAELSYRLALRVDPRDSRARAGLVQASGALAQQLYTSGDFDDALVTLDEGLKVDPGSVRLAGLKSTIEDAKLKREIVISNYPTYKEAGTTIQKAYEQLDTTNKGILSGLKRFSYTYDTVDLTSAIKRSYSLELDVARNTNRLINYRELVSAGIPESAHTTTSAGAASLLPLP